MVLVAATLPAAAAERRVALVIGNGAYAQSPLPNTINDARAMTDVLGRLGFKVITRLNATQREMQLAIVEFGEEIEKGGVGLFYYAGHAVQMRGKNFMIPIGAAISVEDHVEPESVDLNKVIGRMAGARNKLNIVILDACRDNPFGSTFQFYSEGLAQARAPAGTYIAYAAAPGEVAADGTGVNSFYTGALAKILPAQGVPIEETFKQVRASVIKETKGLQVPWTASSITEDFSFNPALPKAAEKTEKGASKAVDREVVFWQSIFSSARPEDFEAYLEQFPAGNFASLARNRLAELRSHKAKESSAANKPAVAETKLRAGTDAELLDVIDRAMADAKTDGADYAQQIQAAVETLNKIRRQREDVSQKAEAARKQVVEAVTHKADKSFQDEWARAQRDATATQEAKLSEAVNAAEKARQKAVADAAEQAKKATEAAYAKARKQAEKNMTLLVAQAQKQAEDNRKRDLTAANDQAAATYRTAMADAEKAADETRKRMIEVARVNAEKQVQTALSNAKREADEKAAASLATAKTEAETKKAKELAALESRSKTDQAKLIEAAKQEATRKYEAAVALARKQAGQERERLLAEAKKAAEAKRQAQLAKLAPELAPKSAPGEGAVTAAELGLGANISPAIRRVIDTAMADARKKGEGRQGQMQAALKAIKGYRRNEPPSTAVAGADNRPARTTLDVAVAKPELKEIIEIAMKRARAEGKSYQGQVQAALDAVKLYRDRETQGGNSPEADKSQTSAMLLGQSQADPELQRIISDAMTQARAKGEDYAAQVRAALAAIKAYRDRTAGTAK
jgi:uncharacterized caspase-like protein